MLRFAFAFDKCILNIFRQLQESLIIHFPKVIGMCLVICLARIEFWGVLWVSISWWSRVIASACWIHLWLAFVYCVFGTDWCHQSTLLSLLSKWWFILFGFDHLFLYRHDWCFICWTSKIICERIHLLMSKLQLSRTFSSYLSSGLLEPLQTGCVAFVLHVIYCVKSGVRSRFSFRWRLRCLLIRTCPSIVVIHFGLCIFRCRWLWIWSASIRMKWLLRCWVVASTWAERIDQPTVYSHGLQSLVSCCFHFSR